MTAQLRATSSSAWPGDLAAGGFLAAEQSFTDYANILVANGYLKAEMLLSCSMLLAPASALPFKLGLRAAHRPFYGNSAYQGLQRHRLGSGERDFLRQP